MSAGDNFPTRRVRNWDKWQSYRKDRGQPPWIKVHREVMRNPDWVTLTDAQRGQLVAIWLLAADRDGVIPASPQLVQKLCYLDSEPDLQLFARRGFLEPDANMTPTRRQRDTPDSETRRQHDVSGAKIEDRERERGESIDQEPNPQLPSSNGFRERDANVTSRRRQHDALEAEAEAEKETTLVPSGDGTSRNGVGYTPDFDAAWNDYPGRKGGNPKKKAFQAWRARVSDGHRPPDIHAGVLRYRKFCRADDKIGTSFVMQAATFFGPEDPPWFLEPWDPKDKGQSDDPYRRSSAA